MSKVQEQGRLRRWAPRRGEWVIVGKGVPIYHSFPMRHRTDLMPRAPDKLAARTYKVKVQSVRFDTDDLTVGETRQVWIGWRGERGQFRWADSVRLKPVPTDLELLAAVELK